MTERPAVLFAAGLQVYRSDRCRSCVVRQPFCGADSAAFVAAARQILGPAVPIMVCSTHPDGQRQATALGAAAYLPKPFDLEEFVATV